MLCVVTWDISCTETESFGKKCLRHRWNQHGHPYWKARRSESTWSSMSSMSSSLQIVLGGFLVNLDGTFWNVLPGLSRQRLCSVLPILLNEVAAWCWEIMRVMVQGFCETELWFRMSARCDGRKAKHIGCTPRYLLLKSQNRKSG